MNRRVKVLTNGFISVLKMDGPILQSMLLDESTVYELVRRNYNVVEVNKSLGKEVKLTLQNFHDSKRFVGGTTAPTNLFPAEGKPMTGTATPVVPVSTGGPIVPPHESTPVVEVAETKPLTKAERKKKRREEEAAKKEAAEAVKPIPDEVPGAAEVAADATGDFTTGEAVADISE